MESAAVRAVLGGASRRTAVRRRPRPGLGRTEDDPGSFKDRAVAAATAGSTSDARTLFLRHLKASPGDAASWEMLAQCEMEQDQAGNAVRCAGEAARLRPAWPEARLTLGRALASMGELVIASHELDAAEAAGRAAAGTPFDGSRLAAELEDERGRVRHALRGWMSSVRRTLSSRARGEDEDEDEDEDSNPRAGSLPAEALPSAASSSSRAGAGASGADPSSSSSSSSSPDGGGAASRAAAAAPRVCSTCSPDAVDLPRPYPPLPSGPAAAAAEAGPARGLGLTWDLALPWAEVDADPALRFTRANVVTLP